MGEAITDIAARMNALIDADGPDAVGLLFRQPDGLLIIERAVHDRLARRRRNPEPLRRRVCRPERDARRRRSDVRIDPDGAGVRCSTTATTSCWSARTRRSARGTGWKRCPGAGNGRWSGSGRARTIVVVDPVRTETADKADIHLAVRPGQDWALLLAMVKVILDEGLENAADCRDLATGVDALRDLVADADLDELAARCEIPRAAIERVARDFAAAPRAMVVTRTGVSLHVTGTIGEWLGHVLNVITGRMDRPGGRRFEPGYVDALKLSGLATPPAHKSRVHGRDLVAGAHALAELPDEIMTEGPGQIRAMVINCGNPVVSGPDGATARRGALATGPAGGHRPGTAGKSSTRTLAVARRALAGARRFDGVDQQPARRAVRAIRAASGRTSVGNTRGVADLRRSRHRDAQTAVRRERHQRLRQSHPRAGAAHPQAGPRVHAAVAEPAVHRHEPKSQRTQGQLARADDQSARSGARAARVRAFPGCSANRRQEGARRPAGVCGPRS